MATKGKRIGPGSCLSSVPVLFLVLINVALGFGGLLIVGVGGYLYANFSAFEELVSQQATVYLLVSGIILFLFSVLAIVGAIQKWKRFLVVYIVFLVALVAGEVAVTFFGLDYLGILENASDAAQGNSTAALDSTGQAISDFLVLTYQTCCLQNSNFCSTNRSDPLFCEPVPVCTPSSADTVCVDTVLDSVDQGVCTLLQGFSQDGNTLVGPSDASCGLGEVNQFLDSFTAFIVDRISIVTIAGGVIGGVEFLLIVFTVYLIVGRRVNYDDRFWENADDGDEDAPVAEIVTEEEFRNSIGRHYVHPEAQPRLPPVLPPSSPRPQSIGSRVANPFANFSSQAEEGTILSRANAGSVRSVAQSVTRQRANSVESSIPVRRMENDPNVIDDVI